MKISVLVAQYFYQHRVLNLPGIGSFYLSDVVDVQTIADKNSRDLIEHIHFAQKAITRPDEQLIEFIRKHTGKIRPLAESDLETFVADGKLMLNIGKPFHIEGIGTLHKNKEGVYEFTPGQPVVQRLEAPTPLTSVDQHDPEKPLKRKSVFDEDPHERRNASIRRTAIGFGLVVGIGIILWGGYSLFTSKVKTEPGTASNSTTNEQDTQRTSTYLHNINDPQKALNDVVKKDSNMAGANATDTTHKAAVTPTPATTPAAPVTAGAGRTFKYILQTTKLRKTAQDMYDKLKPKVEMEAVDSNLFRIVISLPGSPADTARIKDSLHFWYWGARRDKVVTVE
ncbi:hypothetical protein A4D02_33210 [Niastella koreensis]|uniref:CCDC81-like prokaryotic HU domain-containing protein n=2 Tax=Niastella koreensis TaxID=354356 RepID=G8TGH2_NIAKG|nr:hypothetical protein [Niastella koreensis]AEV97395.1 hypothetical protein Niako_1016 [Niastella koreensis GR20-10]OQP45519.1 hypothetical protein A4D02_33210 [Niastella koreensis]